MRSLLVFFDVDRRWAVDAALAADWHLRDLADDAGCRILRSPSPAPCRLLEFNIDFGAGLHTPLHHSCCNIFVFSLGQFNKIPVKNSLCRKKENWKTTSVHF